LRGTTEDAENAERAVEMINVSAFLGGYFSSCGEGFEN
jgi:hypothetical protein